MILCRIDCMSVAIKPRQTKTKNMKKTLTQNEIANELHSDENAGWSYVGAMALAEWLIELDESCGVETEFDRVAIRCDFAEWGSLREWAEGYFSDWRADLGITPEMDDAEIDDVIREFIEDSDHLIEFDGGIIVPSF